MRVLLKVTGLIAIIISFAVTVFFVQWVLSLFGVQGMDGKAAGAVIGILIALLVAQSLKQQ
jgi:uncharacterized membrane protein YcjF (UPF0283 family)